MRIAAHGVGGQTHLLKGGGYSRSNVADAVDLQRLRQGAPQGMVRMQRGVRILKHHLHVAPQIALKAGARRLVIGHYSSRYKDETPLVEEARTLFAESYPATEGTTYTIEKQR